MRTLVLLLSTLLIMHPAQAETLDPVTIKDVYSYATAGKQDNGAVFFTVEHQSPGDKIIKAETDIAAIAELHTHIMEGDVMKMRKVDALEIPEAGTLELKPSADHVMLIGLKKPLAEGETFQLTLSFEKSGQRTIDVPVVKAGVKPAASAEHDNHDSHDSHDHNNDSEAESDHEHHSHH